MPPTRYSSNPNSLNEPVEVIMAVRFADGTISCFQGTSSEPVGVTFEPTTLFADPLASGGYDGTYRSVINWDRGVRRTFIRGAESWDWSGGPGKVPPTAEIEQGQKQINATPGPVDMHEYYREMNAAYSEKWTEEQYEEWEQIPPSDLEARLQFFRRWRVRKEYRS